MATTNSSVTASSKSDLHETLGRVKNDCQRNVRKQAPVSTQRPTECNKDGSQDTEEELSKQNQDSDRKLS